jgi:predicted GH43/DUF377 family glycosyl hydrolase
MRKHVYGFVLLLLILGVEGLSAESGASQGQTAAPQKADWQLGPFVRPVNRPVIGPNKKSVFACPMTNQNVNWESSDAFNPAAVVFGGRICVLYRAEDGSGQGVGGHTSRIGLAKSDDGISFERNPVPVLYPDNDMAKPYEWKGGCEDPRVVEGPDGKFYIYYTMWNRDNPDRLPLFTRIGVASSDDLVHWVKHGPIFAEGLIKKSHKAASVVTKVQQGRLIAEKIKGRYWMYWGEDRICAATSEDLIHWTPVLDEKGELVTIIRPRPDSFDSLLTEAGPPAVVTEKGIILIYNGKNSGADKTIRVGAYAAGQILLDKESPSRLLDRCQNYFFKPKLNFEKTGQYQAGTVFVEGLVYFKEKWYLYYGAADSYVGVAFCEGGMKN